MYEAFYQLSADPFRLSPDPGFSFRHRTYRKAMTYMRHALHRAEGFIMITGQPGTGKTTLINDLIQTLKPGQTVVAKLVSTQLTADDLLDLVAYAFNLDPEGCSKAKVLVQVERFLQQQYHHGRRSLLIVDEAQDMAEDALEELRLLTNLQYNNHQLLQLFLVGQEQLRDTVIKPSLEQLHQRLIAATLLEPLDAENTEAYIKHRLRRAGWKGDPLISTETYAMIEQYSHGIPRRINQLCSRLLLHGCIEEKHRLGTADLRVVVEELQHERLMPGCKEGLTGAVAWPAENFEETYREEPSPPVLTTPVLPSRKPLPRTDKAAQKPSARVAETRHHMPVREPVSVADPGADNHHINMQHKMYQWQQGFIAMFDTGGVCSDASKVACLLRERIRKLNRPVVWSGAVTVMLLITTVLAVYTGDSDSSQRARDRNEDKPETLVQNQSDAQQTVLAAIDDTEVLSVQTRPETPDTDVTSVQFRPETTGSEDTASNATRDSDSGAVLKTGEHNQVLAETVSEAGQAPVQVGDSAETPLPEIRVAMVGPHMAAAADTINESTAEQDNPVRDEPAADQETAPVITHSQGNQAEKAAAPVPVKKVTVAPPLSAEEKIAGLLDHGWRSLGQDRLLVPKNNNAFHYFQRVLKLDPGNSDALNGIEQVVARYTTLATDAFDRDDKEKAEQYIERGFRIRPDNDDLRALHERMNAPPVKPVAVLRPQPVITSPEPEPGDFFVRFKAFFTEQPTLENRTVTEESLELSVYQ